MLNYLAMADLQGAAVEARRYQVMRDYLENLGIDHPRGRIGAYLAGFIFEHLGESGRALRYYQDVQADGEAALARGARRARGASAAESGEVLVVIGAGRTPIKVPKRIPVGAAIGIAGTRDHGRSRACSSTACSRSSCIPSSRTVPSQVQRRARRGSATAMRSSSS